MNWKTVQRKVDDLIPYEHNPRQMTESQAEALKASLEKFNLAEIPAINTDGLILAGHQRIRIMQLLGRGKEVIDVRIPDRKLSHKEVQEYNIRSNKNTGSWDFDILANAFEIDDLTDWGFSEDELPVFTSVEGEGLTDEDSVPDIPEEPKTKLGDLYIMGNHRLLCGDSTNIEHVKILMGDNKADMVFTDPPYNIDYGNIKHQKIKQRNIINDSMSTEDFDEFCNLFIVNLLGFVSGCIYVFGPPGPDGRIMFSNLDKTFHCSTTIIWKKDVFTLGRGKYQNKYEPCWFGWNESGKQFIDDRKLTNVWEFDRPKKSELHPTMKPVELVEYAISHASNTGGVVLDIFGGSGTTLIACEKISRKCNMMELDPHYCDVIVQRWEEYTGKKAILKNG